MAKFVDCGSSTGNPLTLFKCCCSTVHILTIFWDFPELSLCFTPFAGGKEGGLTFFSPSLGYFCTNFSELPFSHQLLIEHAQKKSTKAAFFLEKRMCALIRPSSPHKSRRSFVVEIFSSPWVPVTTRRVLRNFCPAKYEWVETGIFNDVKDMTWKICGLHGIKLNFAADTPTHQN